MAHLIFYKLCIIADAGHSIQCERLNAMITAVACCLFCKGMCLFAWEDVGFSLH